MHSINLKNGILSAFVMVFILSASSEIFGATCKNSLGKIADSGVYVGPVDALGYPTSVRWHPQSYPHSTQVSRPVKKDEGVYAGPVDALGYPTSVRYRSRPNTDF
jgi:hypothetical protein